MALAVNFIDRRGPSNEMRRQLQPKKAILAVYIAAKEVLPFLSLLTRQSASVLKQACHTCGK